MYRKAKLLWIFCLLVFIHTVESKVITASETKNTNYRLTDEVRPVNYDISLRPHFTAENGREAFTFDGSADITLSTDRQNVSSITLHSRDLNISSQAISHVWGDSVPSIKSTIYDEETHFLTFILDRALLVNQSYILSFKYVGTLRTDMVGFYRSSYEEDGQTKWLASTQCQPVHARRIFPCFDEPKFKATFVVQIDRPKHFKPSLSNTKIERSETNDRLNLVRETFYKTPPMSTYLLAFVVSEFVCRENQKGDYSVCARPKAYDQTGYSFEFGQKSLAKFDKLLGYEYFSVPQITKMTMVALPDFEAGAMENWGLITYRETALLYSPSVSTSIAQQRVAAVVVHEQAHMWFGDLVTCDWWEHTWLNEGFARFFQYFLTGMLEEKWGLEHQFVVEQLQTALGKDSLSDSEALSHAVNTPQEIKDRFGTISYNKGASVIRMMQHTIGNDTFYKALQKYLRTNEFSTSVPEKLYAAFQDEVKNELDVAKVMGSWVTQPGYPVVNVQVQSDRKKIIVSQKRFLLTNDGQVSDQLWEVPLTYAMSSQNSDFSNTKSNVILSRSPLTIEVNEEIDWIVFNVQQTGFYRVNYDERTWNNIAEVLNKSHSKVHVFNRAQIIDDSLNLARADQLNYTKALQAIDYLKAEIDYIPWLSALNNLNYILTRFTLEETHIFGDYLLNLLNNVYSHLGFQPKPNEPRLDTYNRNNILSQACGLGHKGCIIDAQNEFNKSRVTSRAYKIPVDIVSVVYCTVISEGSGEEWDYFWENFKKENVAAEQVVILSALGCTKDTRLIRIYLDRILSVEVRLQDKLSAFVATFRKKQNVNFVLDYILENHKHIATAFETEKDVATIISRISDRFTDDNQIEKVRRFVDQNHSVYGSSKVIKQALINAENNMKWAHKNIPVIKKHLQPADSNKSTGDASSIQMSFVVFILTFITIFSI